MKKVILIIMLLLLLTSCAPKQESVGCGVLRKDAIDSGVVVFLNEEMEVIKSIDINYPDIAYSNRNVLYVESNDDYLLFDLTKHKQIASITNVEGYLIYLDEKDYISFENDSLIIRGKGKSEDINFAVNFWSFDSEYLYLADYDKDVLVIDLKDFSVANQFTLSFEQIIGFALVDEKLYLASNEGYSELSHQGIAMTYIYPFKFDEISNAIDDHVIVFENKEMIVYKISFDKIAMKYELELDNNWYDTFYYDKIFKDYLENDYDLIFFTR